MSNLSHASNYLNQTNESIKLYIAEVFKRLQDPIILEIFKDTFFANFANNIRTLNTTQAVYQLQLAQDLLDTLKNLVKNEEKRRQWENRVQGLSQKRKFKERRESVKEKKIKKAQEENPYAIFQGSAAAISSEGSDSSQSNGERDQAP